MLAYEPTPAGYRAPPGGATCDAPHLERRVGPSAAEHAPFAKEGDRGYDHIVTPWAKKHTASDVHIGGPEQVRPEEIAFLSQLQRARNPYAGRSQQSQVVLTDEPSQAIQMPAVRNADARARHSVVSSMMTDQMPEGAGCKPPPGFFYNGHGNLQALPAHAAAAAHSNISPVLFGAAAAADGSGHDKGAQVGGKARVSGQGHGSLVDAIVFSGSGDPSQEERLASLQPRPGRRYVKTSPSRMAEALEWQGAEQSESMSGDAVTKANGAHHAHHGPSQHVNDAGVPISRPLPSQIPPPAYHQDWQRRAPADVLDYAAVAAPLPRAMPISLYQPPRGGHAGEPPKLDAGAGLAAPPQPLLYDAEQRRWVTRDGHPVSRDPILRGGGGPATQMQSKMMHVPSGGSMAPSDGLPKVPSGGVGVPMRHPKLWFQSTAQSAYLAPEPMPSAGPGAMALEVKGRIPRQFTEGFAPPRPGGGFNH